MLNDPFISQDLALRRVVPVPVFDHAAYRDIRQCEGFSQDLEPLAFNQRLLKGLAGKLYDLAVRMNGARFDVELPRFALRAGKRLLLPANLFRWSQTNAFGPAERKYPLYFPYTYEELDNITVQMPPGFSAQSLPDGQDIRLSEARFITTRSSKEDALVQTRALVVNSIYFQPEQYVEIRGFFEHLKAADEEHIVIGPSQP